MSDPATGRGGEPAWGTRSGEPVALHLGEWRDGRWSYLYGTDTDYASAPAAPSATSPLPDDGQVAVAHKQPVWTWQVPVYFWLGGIAAGASFVAFAFDLAGDRRSAVRARRVTLAAAVPCAPLLVADLGRPERFLNMLRVFKPRSPMSTGAWCLFAFSNAAAGAVAADVAGRHRLARRLGAADAVLGIYLGSYTGALLASTAIPTWSRSRRFLGPIFVASATAGGAAACRLALGPNRGLGRVEAGAVIAELVLSAANERRTGAEELRGPAFQAVRALHAGALALRLRGSGRAASLLVLAGAALLRHAWVAAGRV